MIIFIVYQNFNLLQTDEEDKELDENLGSYWKNLNGID